MKLKSLILILILILLVVSSSCFFRTSSITVRGYVHHDGKPVAGADVRLGGSGVEATTTTGLDGKFTLTVKHRPSQMLEVKILKPGYVHDTIDFPGFAAPEDEIKIELKKLFTIPSTR